MTDLEGTVIMEPINHKIFLGLSLAGHLRRFSLSLSLALASLFDFLWDHQKGKSKAKLVISDGLHSALVASSSATTYGATL